MLYRKEIDGLRALAVIPVVLFHSGFSFFKGGYLGVDIFFVISGYLITSILIKELSENKYSIIQFYERRVRRILPLLYVVLLVTFPISILLLLPSELKEAAASFSSIQVFLSNFVFWKQSGYFSSAAELKPFLHTWSLAVEEQYYLFFPIVIAYLWRKNKSLVLPFLLVTFFASLFLAYWGNTFNPDQAFFLLPFRAWELLSGAIAAYLLFDDKFKHRFQTKNANAFSLLGLILILASLLNLNDLLHFKVFSLIAVIGSTLIVLYSNEKTLVGKLLSLKPLVFIGLISYSLYLWHQPFLAFLKLSFEGEIPEFIKYIVFISLILISYLSWKYVETPVRKRLWFQSRNDLFITSLVVSFIYFVVGVVVYKTNGLANRYPESMREIATINPNDAGEYVRHRFFSLQNKPFEDNEKHKILVIGDSFSEDILNVIFETYPDLEKHNQFRTRHIKHNCGVLYVDFDKLKSNISFKNVSKCERTKLYGDTKLDEMIKQANEVWFASAWMPWQMDFVEESIKNLQSNYPTKKIKVFGTKDFGKVSMRAMLKIPLGNRAGYQQDVNNEKIYVNNRLSEILDKKTFVNTQYYLGAGSSNTSPVFDKSGNLLTYDGAHLTRNGAIFVGNQFKHYGLNLLD